MGMVRERRAGRRVLVLSSYRRNQLLDQQQQTDHDHRSTGDAADCARQRRPRSQHLQARRLFGQPDYLPRVITRDLPALQKLYDDRLATLPGVQRLNSTLVMKSFVENRPLPL